MGYFCVDNLPPELLHECLRLEVQHGVRRVAVAVDVRTAGSLPALTPVLAELRAKGVQVRVIFLDASTENPGATVLRDTPAAIPCPWASRRLKPMALTHAMPCSKSIEMERSLLDALR